ncbi:MAG: NifU family protein, partial [Nocardioidaceae bacterium]
MAGPAHVDTSPADLRAVGERIDVLLEASASGGAVARERAEELVRLVADLYGAGIERIMDLLYDAGRLDDAVLASLADDDLVASLLLVHGLHPYGVAQRVEQALDRVRPYLGSHGGDVELLQVTAEGIVRLRLLGSCDGCPSSSATLELAVEGAIEAAAPEVVRIEVEAPAREPGPLVGPAETHGAFIPVDSLRSRVSTSSTSDKPGLSTSSTGDGPPAEVRGAWEPLPDLSGLHPGGVTEVTVQQSRVLVCRVGADLFAFHSRCARCDAPLAGATVGRRLGGAAGDALLTCPACQAHYDVRRAGACVDVPDLHLDPLPLLEDHGVPAVAVPTPV